MNRDELDLLTEHVRLNDELDAAKAAYNGEEIGSTQKALKDAEWAAAEFTMYWRGIRDSIRLSQAADAVDADGVAAPTSVKAGINQTPKAKVD